MDFQAPNLTTMKKHNDSNLDFYEYFRRMAERHQPRLAFADHESHSLWKEKAIAKLRELMGEFPLPVDLNPRLIDRTEDQELHVERILLDVEEEMALPCVVFKPADMASNHSGRAIICVHGHGPLGKEAVAGDETTEELTVNIRKHNYNYGRQMARRGYLTISPDLRGFGERAGAPTAFTEGRDPCNLHFLCGAMLGRWPLTMHVWDIFCCLRYLQSRPEVDPRRIGIMGLSLGGTVTTFATALFDEIRCADIIGYLHPWRTSAFERWNTCGAQILPHVYTWFDTHDVAGMIAPRPLLVEMGEQDTCFHIEDQLKSWQALERIYEAADAREDLWQDLHSGGHQFSGARAFDFFDRYL